MAQTNGMPGLTARIFYSKLTFIPLRITGNFLTHFSSSFLLTHGDPNGIYNVPNNGILFWVEPVLIIFGFISLWKQNRKLFWWLLVVLFAALIPDSLTRVAPSSARIHITLPFIMLLDAVGLSSLIYFVRRGTKEFAVIFILKFAVITLLTVNIWWFWQNYLYTLPIQNSRAWQIGVKEMVLQTQLLAPNYKKVWMSRECWGWIHVVFHTKFAPQDFQKVARHSVRNDLGFWWVSDFGNYHLEWFPPGFKFNETSTLYVGIPQEFPTGTKPLAIIKHPITNQELFWITNGTGEKSL